ncbi:Hypothetical protein CINCED_3A014271 [Cinara cedri]|uniref:Uncharacterized protein n=1 Tax=Cinara cedri TaxID=506608 RepID=A0A5E4MK41_9HEMI|nr:Hypothetical protein CINCED_3A014271 [Cinara cedri]
MMDLGSDPAGLVARYAHIFMVRLGTDRSDVTNHNSESSRFRSLHRVCLCAFVGGIARRAGRVGLGLETGEVTSNASLCVSMSLSRKTE